MWQGEYLQIDLGVVRQVKHLALQGRPGSSDYVKTFYLKYGDNGLDFNSYGENATVKYKVNHLFPVGWSVGQSVGGWVSGWVGRSVG